MPLQIRRGTEAERLVMPVALAPGELLYTTDDKRIYVGDGATLGGIMVTGYTDEDAQDAVGDILTSSTHSGISFSYNDVAGTLSATVDLSDYTGTIKASAIKGTIVGDDSTILVDAVAGVLRGQLVGSLTGNVTGNVTGNLTGNVTGDVTGNVSGVLTGSVVGSVVGDVKGSVFADDSSILVDAVDRKFYGSIDIGDTLISNDSITGTNFYLGTAADPLSVFMNLDTNLQVRQIVAPLDGRFITLSQSAGTFASPTAVAAGDILGGMLVKAYTSSSVQAIAGTFGFFVDSTASISGGDFVKSKAIISASTDTGADLADSLILDSAGKVTSNAFVATEYFQLPVYADDTARSTAIASPAKGMMVFMTSGTSPSVTNKTVVYDGSAWVALH